MSQAQAKNNTRNLKTSTRKGPLGAAWGQEHPGGPPIAAKARQEPRAVTRGYQWPPATRENYEIVKNVLKNHIKSNVNKKAQN